MINKLMNTDLSYLLPESFETWKAIKTINLNIPTDLYNYIDGGAELYLSYGFNTAISRTYSKENQPEVLVEIYDLKEPRNAFGVFTQTREEEISKYGQGTYKIEGAVFFWKNNYYVSLSTWESTPESDKFIDIMASAIDTKINLTGNVPGLMKFLPKEGLVPNGFKYFHHYIWLNSFFFISDQNVFNIDESTDAVIAKYGSNEKRHYLLIIEYPGKQASLAAFNSFSKEFFPEGLHNNCIMLEDKTWLSAALKDNLLIGVFNGESSENVSALLSKVMGLVENNNIKN